MVVIITMDNHTQLCIEGLGPRTILGAVEDVLNGSYGALEGAVVTKIEIGDGVNRLGAQFEVNHQPIIKVAA